MGFFDRHAVTLRRPTGSESRGSDGRVSVSYTDSTIRGNLQRAPKKRTSTGREGERSDDRWSFASATEVRARDELGRTPPDLIVVPAPLAHPTLAVAYEVREVNGDALAGPLPHYEVLLVRIAEGANP